MGQRIIQTRDAVPWSSPSVAAVRDAGCEIEHHGWTHRVPSTLTREQENEELVRSAFDHAPIGMTVIGQDGRWLRVNDACCEMLG